MTPSLCREYCTRQQPHCSRELISTHTHTHSHTHTHTLRPGQGRANLKRLLPSTPVNLNAQLSTTHIRTHTYTQAHVRTHPYTQTQNLITFTCLVHTLGSIK